MCMGLWAFNQYQYTSKDYYCLKVLKISSYTMITENLLKNNISNPLWHKRERESIWFNPSIKRDCHHHNTTNKILAGKLALVR